jgi:hypothetical protein
MAANDRVLSRDQWAGTQTKGVFTSAADGYGVADRHFEGFRARGLNVKFRCHLSEMNIGVL